MLPVTYLLRASWHIRPSNSSGPLQLSAFRSRISSLRRPFPSLSFVSTSFLVSPFYCFPSEAQLQSLFLSCLIICQIIFHLRQCISSLGGLISALSNSSSVLTWSCQHNLKNSSKAPVVENINHFVVFLVHFSTFHIRIVRLVMSVIYKASLNIDSSRGVTGVQHLLQPYKCTSDF